MTIETTSKSEKHLKKQIENLITERDKLKGRLDETQVALLVYQQDYMQLHQKFVQSTTQLELMTRKMKKIEEQKEEKKEE